MQKRVLGSVCVIVVVMHDVVWMRGRAMENQM